MHQISFKFREADGHVCDICHERCDGIFAAADLPDHDDASLDICLHCCKRPGFDMDSTLLFVAVESEKRAVKYEAWAKSNKEFAVLLRDLTGGKLQAPDMAEYEARCNAWEKQQEAQREQYEAELVKKREQYEAKQQEAIREGLTTHVFFG